MKISEVPKDYVFTRIGAGKDVVAVDYERRTFIEIGKMTIAAVQALLLRADNGSVHFFQIEVTTE